MPPDPLSLRQLWASPLKPKLQCILYALLDKSWGPHQLRIMSIIEEFGGIKIHFDFVSKNLGNHDIFWYLLVFFRDVTQC